MREYVGSVRMRFFQSMAGVGVGLPSIGSGGLWSFNLAGLTLERGRFWYFGIYCLGLGVISLWLTLN